jgi:uncharacterized membrane protein
MRRELLDPPAAAFDTCLVNTYIRANVKIKNVKETMTGSISIGGAGNG